MILLNIITLIFGSLGVIVLGFLCSIAISFVGKTYFRLRFTNSKELAASFSQVLDMKSATEKMKNVKRRFYSILLQNFVENKPKYSVCCVKLCR